MAARRHRSATPRHVRRKLPAWVLILIGLTLGALITWTVQTLFFRTPKPFPGLANLFAPRKAAPVEEPKKPAAPQPVKPKLDFYTVLPEIETVIPERESRPSKAPAPAPSEADTHYILQAASFANLEDADRLKAKLALNGLEAHIEKVSIEGRGQYFRVRLGPFARLQDLDSANQKLAQQGIKAMRLKVQRAAER